MNEGFFTDEEIRVNKIQPRTTGCGACKLLKTCKSPKMPPHGKGRKGILIIAEAPSKIEDQGGVKKLGSATDSY